MDEQATQVVPVVGIEKLYVAKLLKDSLEGVTFDIPKYLAGIKEISIKPKVNIDEFYAENKLWASESTLASVDVEVNLVDFTTDDECYVFGHTKDGKGGIIYKDDDVAPQLAILIKANKKGGGIRYLALYNGQFSISDEDYKGKEGKSNFQAKKAKATFAPLKYNGQWKYKIDSEDGMTDQEFFSKVLGVEGMLADKTTEGA
ncbi:TPA: phage tail protein [Clostridium botulinum]|nr:phage tail protein [Clostridium botulinum]